VANLMLTWPKTTSEAKRLIKQGAVKVNGVKITDTNTELPVGYGYVISIGRRLWKRVNLIKK